MNLYYGIEGSWHPVQLELCRFGNKGETFHVPISDTARFERFKFDPLQGTVKKCKLQYDDGNCIVLDDVEGCLFDSQGIIMKFNERTAAEKLEHIHSQVQISAGSMKDEYPEQIMACLFIKPENKVLEIGGNIGRNSVTIGKLLQDSRNLVVLECDPISAHLLAKNRDANNLEFSVEDSALSARKLYQQGWNTQPSDEDIPGWTQIKTITYNALKGKYAIDFDTLVLDCEGAFYWILKDYPNILNGVNTVIMENDYGSLEHYNFVKEVLEKDGFALAYSKELNLNVNICCVNFFFQVFIRCATQDRRRIKNIHVENASNVTLPVDFDGDIYRFLHEDVAARFHSPHEAGLHYLRHGCSEKRTYNFKSRAVRPMFVFLSTNVKDERNIREWLQYHSTLGFDSILLFDDISENSLLDLEQEFENVTVVRGHTTKSNFITLALKYARMNHFDFMLHIDSDEYLYLTDTKSVKQFLMTFPYSCNAIYIHWLFFGSNYLEQNEKETILDVYTKSDSKVDRHVKALVRVNAVDRPSDPHTYSFHKHLLGQVYNTSGQLLLEHGAIQTSYEHDFRKHKAYIAHFHNQSWQDHIRRHVNRVRDDAPSYRQYPVDFKNSFHASSNNVDNFDLIERMKSLAP